MNIGIRLHDTAPGTLEQRLDFARAQGFSCAHLALSKTLEGFDMLDAPARLEDAALAERVRAAFDSRGMGCAVLGCYLALATPDEEELRRTQAVYRAHLRFSRRIGAGVVGTETPPAASARMDAATMAGEEALQLFIRCVRPVVRWAEEEGATLAIEPVCTHIVSTPERAERVLEALHSDSVRIILDSVNLLTSEMVDRADAVVEDAIARLGDRVSVLHMKDFTEAPGEPRPRSIACGMGETEPDRSEIWQNQREAEIRRIPGFAHGETELDKSQIWQNHREGRMHYESLLRLARERDLPMTLEDTTPDNAEAARLYLEGIAAQMGL